MSGICGVVNFDGAPVDRDALRRMTEAAAFRGPDGITYWVDGNVGLAHLALHSTPESLLETQPLCSADGMFWLIADARVDNRDELIRTLTTGGYLHGTTATDADLILGAYECWGEDCPKYIIGDFVFAVWSKRDRSLFCVRDPIGVRLLHYRQVSGGFFFASSVGSLVTGLQATPVINNALVMDLIAGRYERWVYETSYEGVFRLPQGYSMRVAAGRVSLKRYWVLGGQPSIHYSRDREYVEHFRELLERAVRSRLRSITAVGILVSGGLDSSSIACLADLNVRSQDASACARLYSCVFDHTPAANERSYLEAVVQKCSHLVPTMIPSDDCWGLKEFAGDNGYPMDEPEVGISRALLLGPVRQAFRDGCRVVVAGNGGDQVLGGEPYHTPYLLGDVGVGRLVRELPHFHKYSQRPVWKLLFRSWGGAYIPDALRSLISGILGTRARGATAVLGVRGQTLATDLLPPPQLNDRSSKASYSQLTSGLYSARLVTLDVLAAYAGVEWRFPFLDRTLIDFMLRLPGRLRFRNGVIKYILREGLADILPASVYRRSSFVHFSELDERGLRERERARVGDYLQSPRVVRAGFVDNDRLQEAWHEYWHTMQPLRYSHLIGFLCAEAWLRVLEQQKAPILPGKNAN